MKAAWKWLGAALGGLVVLVGVLLGVVKLMWSFGDAPPEYATGWRDVPPAQSNDFMIAAANPIAVEAGISILQAGGSAMDAAVAVQMALNVVEPQSSGIGGGAFFLVWDAAQRRLVGYDGRETAPQQATPTLFQHDDGSPYDFVEAVVGGRSVGIPGVLRALEHAHRAHGRLPWSRLFAPAIELASNGFPVSPRLHELLRRDPHLRTQPAARALFYHPDGRALAVGHRLVNRELAQVFAAIAQGGADAFYEGPIAHDIVRAVREAQRPSLLTASLNSFMTLVLDAPYGTGWLADVPNGGVLTLEDLANYRAKVREPLCIDAFEHRICGMPPPTAGGVTTLQIIAMLSLLNVASHAPNSAEALHLLAEVERLAYADRDLYIGDPDFVDVPLAGLLHPEYLQSRVTSIALERVMTEVSPGVPPGAVQGSRTTGVSLERPSTTHFVVVDGDGNMVSMTSSIENVFGSRVMVRGFILNNQLTDFAFIPERGGRTVANALAPGKRPRSSMSPLVIFDRTGRAVGAVGSPGGSRIIGYTAQATLGMLAWGLSPQEAIELPHVINLGRGTELEDMGWPREDSLHRVADTLRAWGHRVVLGEQNSGLHAVFAKDGQWQGGADPRREGVALGRLQAAGAPTGALQKQGFP